jgi:hypothetical protein
MFNPQAFNQLAPNNQPTIGNLNTNRNKEKDKHEPALTLVKKLYPCSLRLRKVLV